MALPDDLVAQARLLASVDPTRPKQASLRRAVSTAYYAVFHLLTGAAAANWKNRDQRRSFGRTFDHGKMAKASGRIGGQSFPNQDPRFVQHLRFVARAFVQLQDKRHTADYDGNRHWSRTEVDKLIEVADQAFASWRAVRKTKIAQDYLLQFLVQR